jgi:putative pyruvate formate lyase activating enzyme
MRSGSYVYLSDEEWADRISSLDLIASNCELCPRKCHINRHYQRGFCNAPGEMHISSIFPHHGEEPPISGISGSGTIFFSHCTLKCCFCQNYQISHEYEGKKYSVDQLASEMIRLQDLGCHNINLVTGTHYLPWIVKSIRQASSLGLHIPIVYNSSGYELPDTLSTLQEIIDIYLPDMKYGIEETASKYSNAPNYIENNQHSIKEMFRQTGPLKIDSDGIAYRGLIIRHLVLPSNMDSSKNILNFLNVTFDPMDITISLMAQYRPLFKAYDFPEIDRPLLLEEYSCIKNSFVETGFEGYYQELDQIDRGFLINFKKRKTERLTGDEQNMDLH